MPQFARIALAVVAGFIAGSIVNMALIVLSGKVIPPPAGADTTTMEGLKASIHLFEPKHFLFPWLAHALGTLVGACVASLIANGESKLPYQVVGGLFLAGGITNVFMIPGPTWFSAADVLLAYLPMAWLGNALAGRMRPVKV